MQLEDLFTNVHRTRWGEISSKVGDDDAIAFASNDIEMTIHMA